MTTHKIFLNGQEKWRGDEIPDGILEQFQELAESGEEVGIETKHDDDYGSTVWLDLTDLLAEEDRSKLGDADFQYDMAVEDAIFDRDGE